MRPLLAAAAVLLALTACSGGDDFPSFAGATTTTAPGGVQAGADGTATTVRPGTGNAFCDFLQTYNDRFGRFNAGVSNPQQLRTVMNEALAAVKEAEATAPPEIKADVATTNRGFEALVRALDQVGFDITKLRLDSLTILQSPDFVAASQRLQNYMRQNCL